MKAVCWHGTQDVRVETVPDPEIISPRDAVIQVTSTAICGSDLHLYGGYMPSMEPGDILGHEFMGRVVEVGREVKRVRVGDRVVVPFPIACGHCWFCRNEQWSLCDNTNPNAHLACKMFGHSPAGVFGYSHLTGGYAGGQAEYVRVPFADVGCLQIRDELAATSRSCSCPTSSPPPTWRPRTARSEAATWSRSGVPVRSGSSRSGAHLLGAERVICLEREQYRMRRAEEAGAETLRVDDGEVQEMLRERTGGRGPDVCIEAVGMEAHGPSFDAMYDRLAQRLFFESERPVALRQAILACGRAGRCRWRACSAGSPTRSRSARRSTRR